MRRAEARAIFIPTPTGNPRRDGPGDLRAFHPGRDVAMPIYGTLLVPSKSSSSIIVEDLNVS